MQLVLQWCNKIIDKLDKMQCKGLFTWRKVIPGRRVTLPPEPSFTEGLHV